MPEIIIAGLGNTSKQQEAMAEAIKDNFGISSRITAPEVDKREQPGILEQGQEWQKQIVAALEATEIDELLSLTENKYPSVRSTVLRNENWPVNMLRDALTKMASDDSWIVRKGVAESRHAPTDVLTRLATDCPSVREAVAKNDGTLPDVLAMLSEDEKKWVRNGVAGNKNTHPSYLTVLAEDEEYIVRAGVAQNPRTDPNVIAFLAEDENPFVREFAAANLEASPEILSKLANDEAPEVRWRVAENPNTPEELLKSLAKDEDEFVAGSATKNIKERRDSSERVSGRVLSRG